jgi:hypothetical protein
LKIIFPSVETQYLEASDYRHFPLLTICIRWSFWEVLQRPDSSYLKYRIYIAGSIRGELALRQLHRCSATSS